MKRLLFSCGDRFTLQTSPRKARIAGVAVQHKRHRTNLFSGGAGEQVCQTKIGDRQLQHVGLSDVGRSRSQNSTIHMSAVCRVDTNLSSLEPSTISAPSSLVLSTMPPSPPSSSFQQNSNLPLFLSSSGRAIFAKRMQAEKKGQISSSRLNKRQTTYSTIGTTFGRRNAAGQ